MDIHFVVSFAESELASREAQVDHYQAFLSDLVAVHGGSVAAFEGLMTPQELEAMSLTAKLANTMSGIIGQDGPQSVYDRTEMVYKVHDIQHMIMAQAASRAYPETFRPLGGRIEPLTDEKVSDTVTA